jgi:cob(I)alamin adenosyltransferase
VPKLTKIYTRKGDDGFTNLGNRQRVPKDSLRVATYGDVDELNSVLGVALAAGLSSRLELSVQNIQNELFNLGADLAYPVKPGEERLIPQITAKNIAGLEKLIDELFDSVGTLENFVLPGGTLGAAHLHVARTVCRRAERKLVTISGGEDISAESLRYLNRLSDALFVMALYENKQQGLTEKLWDSSV